MRPRYKVLLRISCSQKPVRRAFLGDKSCLTRLAEDISGGHVEAIRQRGLDVPASATIGFVNGADSRVHAITDLLPLAVASQILVWQRFPAFPRSGMPAARGR